ncbi:MAG: hypothetical protein P1V19_19995, partial [Gimesia sp.]|nr:hypothetical protein [Gimesia sp.]
CNRRLNVSSHYQIKRLRQFSHGYMLRNGWLNWGKFPIEKVQMCPLKCVKIGGLYVEGGFIFDRGGCD